MNDTLPHVGALDERHFTIDALTAVKNLPTRNSEELERYMRDQAAQALAARPDADSEEDPANTEPIPRRSGKSALKISLDLGEIERIVGDRHFTNALIEEFEHISTGPSRVLLLHNSLLVMAIGAFEVLVGAIATRFYLKHRSALDSSEKVFTFAELRDFAEVNDATDEIISRRISDLLHGELETWNSWFKENAGDEFDNLAMDYDVLKEAFQRRHVIVHNGGLASRQYLQKVKGSTAHVGERLAVDTDYLNDALDQLDVLGTTLGVLSEGTWNPASRDYTANLLLRRCFELMSESRWGAAEALAAVGKTLKCKSVLKSSLQCNEWLCRAERAGYSAIREEVARFDTSDKASRFELVRLVLLEEVDAALPLVPDQVRSGELTRGELIAWPILRKLREHENFATTLAQVDAEDSE